VGFGAEEVTPLGKILGVPADTLGEDSWSIMEWNYKPAGGE
jgi:hypothetical protein